MKFQSLILSLCCLALGCSMQSRKVYQAHTSAVKLIAPNSIYPPIDLVIQNHSAWTKTHYPEKIKEFKKAPLEFNDIVFLGNSITEFGGDSGKRFNLPNIRNRGISGDVTEGVIKRLGEIIYYKPKAVFLMIGINDLFIDSVKAEYVANNVIKIAAVIKKESPSTKIFVESVLPTNNKKLVEKIHQTNLILKAKASINQYNFINIHVLMAGHDDLMIKDYTRDGIHLTELGYQIWVAKVKKYLR